MNILHLSHTDISSDSRILKEMNCISKGVANSLVFGIGVLSENEKHKTRTSPMLSIYSINLISRKWRRLPTAVRHVISLIELTMKMLFKAIKIRPDLVHCHDTMVLPLGCILKVFTGCKVIYDAHELESDRNGLLPHLKKLTLWAEKICWRFVNVLIVVSPAIANWYKLNIGDKNTEIVMNAPYLMNTEEEVFSKDYLQDEFFIPPSSKIYIYIGILGKGRGVDLILEAFKDESIDSHVVFLGYGEFESRIKSASENYSNIHLHPAVPHAQVVPIAKSADFGFCLIENVSLSDYYCLPNKLFEYAFSDIRIIASNFPEISRIVRDYDLGECCDLTLEGVKDAIKTTSSIEYTKSSEKDLYPLSWAAQKEKIICLYKQLIEENV